MTQEVNDVLNDLIETLKDGEFGFRSAAEEASRNDLRQVFQKYSNQRAEFARTLQMQVQRSGEEAEDSGSVAGALHRGWLSVKSSVATWDDQALLEECERGEDSAVESYRNALGNSDLVGSARSIVESQYSQIQEAHDQIRSLRDSMKISSDVGGLRA
jgi:uncharacterized protein (TIGR02284 family)